MLYRNRYRVESTRLPDHDYAASAWYHVVICTKHRRCWFGEVSEGTMVFSKLGRTAHQFCAAIPEHVERAVVDAFVVMPNHVHAIIGLLPVVSPEPSPEESLHVETLRHQETLRATSLRGSGGDAKNQAMADRSPKAGSLGAIVRSYKSAVTRWARQNETESFAWQPRF
ncbi:MAG: transposase [Bacteroidota bacterium]